MEETLTPQEAQRAKWLPIATGAIFGTVGIALPAGVLLFPFSGLAQGFFLSYKTSPIRNTAIVMVSFFVVAVIFCILFSESNLWPPALVIYTMICAPFVWGGNAFVRFIRKPVEWNK